MNPGYSSGCLNMGPNHSGSLSLLSISTWFLLYILKSPERKPVAHYPALTPRTVILASAATEALSSSAVIPLFTFVLCMCMSSSIEIPSSFKVKYQLLLKFECLPWQLCTFKAVHRRIALEKNFTLKECYYNV